MCCSPAALQPDVRHVAVLHILYYFKSFFFTLSAGANGCVCRVWHPTNSTLVLVHHSLLEFDRLSVAVLSLCAIQQGFSHSSERTDVVYFLTLILALHCAFSPWCVHAFIFPKWFGQSLIVSKCIRLALVAT